MGGRGRGRGRGRGGRTNTSNDEASNTATIKELNQAAKDIQKMLGDLSLSPGSSSHKPRGGKSGGSRGSNSMMDLSMGGGGYDNRGSGRGRGRGRGQGQGGIQQQPARGGGRGRNNFQPNQQNYNPGYQRDAPNCNSFHPRSFDPQMGGYAPPPSYDETMRYNPSSPPEPLFKRPSIPPKYGEKYPDYPPRSGCQGSSIPELVKTMTLFKGQWATSDMLCKQLQWDEEKLSRVVYSRQDIFASMRQRDGMTVELVPNVKLCSNHVSEGGCVDRTSCSFLHFCSKYLTGYCDSHPCPYGHKFDTNHNTAILSKLYLDFLSHRELFDIIKKIVKGNEPPNICGYYNTKDGCRKNDGCRFLHICKDHVISGGNCPNGKCPYNHRTDTKQCKGFLLHHGMSINESPRDILLNLRSSLQNLNKPLPQDGTHNYCSSSNEKQGKFKQDKDNNREKQPRSATVRSTDINGDVEIPEICVYSVNDRCTNEKKGCKYLHAKSLFHWQCEKKKKWYNLRIYQSKCIETAYREVAKEGVTIPPLDARKIESHNQKILDLLGTNSWKADFQRMNMRNPSGSELKIRRISTASSVVSSLPQATVYNWYFGDENDSWIPYGQVDSLGKQQYVCNITSADIEKQFLKDSTQPMIISNAQYNYQLDFQQMTQTNLTTHKMRKVRRRPAMLSYQKTGMDRNDDKLPKHWRPMQADQTHVLIELDKGTQEYQDVVGRVRLTLPRVTIFSVKRLQNQYLWRLMQYKKADLLRSYSNYQLNVQKLFHGTNLSLIDGICKENIDGRKCLNKMQIYGKGTYFSNSAATAQSHCSSDGNGSFLLLAEVIIGEVTSGHSNLSRPPPNPVTGALFDTTVDNITTPTIFVKYEKEEYYPEYVVEVY
ncbi:hypothetical protein Pmani_007489 [Petrolisthes manimaculis]|uniref:Poly [ADP-ribose] polymerase 12 n=1 Tax=Petrolisthes manimaculis TaxID=1843537 RepID=A0AAE1Q8B6_9EUCA|nr:hypothetical protein Pmani_007489 [Petrolisthes manimaculis]